MKINSLLPAAALAAILLSACQTSMTGGAKSLFNGRDLTGWNGRMNHWSVQDGAITGKTTKENPAQGNNFLIWTNGTVADFELRFSYKIVPNGTKGFGNSGVQYRSKDFGNFVIGGYQADFEAGTTYSGILYEERFDGILAQRGQKTTVKTVEGKTKIEVTGSLGDSKEIQANIKKEDWNGAVMWQPLRDGTGSSNSDPRPDPRARPSHRMGPDDYFRSLSRISLN